MDQKLSLKISGFTKTKAKQVCLFVADELVLGEQATKIWAATAQDLANLANAARFKAKKSSFFNVFAPAGSTADRIVLAGIGDLNAETDIKEFASAGGTIVNMLRSLKSDHAEIIFDIAASAEQIAAFAAGLRLGHYRFDKYKTNPGKQDDLPPAELKLTLQVADKKAVMAADKIRDAVTQGTLTARNLVNEPANILGTAEFAQAAKDLEEHGLEVEILDEKQMTQLGMGSLLAVGYGSRRPSLLAIMKWNGGKKGDAPIAFVGKGVVFDSGGLSIKPAGGMEDMKGDMGGAAAVTGTMKTLGLRKAKVNAVGVIGLVENMADGNAMRPSDIITSMSGQTIEVLNTDAEGRMVLADALWYTKETFKPKFMVNLATLTGANMVALGDQHAGLFSNDDELSQNLTQAGLDTGERVWRMPMGPEYDKLINSKFADMKNIGGRWAGAITAAQFLKRFVGEVPWAHIDLSTAMNVPATPICKSWATGFGVALLDKMVRDHHE
ncbi:leucyl aminopeptidase [Maritalea sp.]|uniref:leucyl aminopeptidase n=1 Tax=Maritalea sp. TaxID=2003361 RepID=UPI0039E62583